MKKLFTMLVVLFAAFTLNFATPTYAQVPQIEVVVQWDHVGTAGNPDLAGFELQAWEDTTGGDILIPIYHDSDEDGTADTWGPMDDVPNPDIRTVTFFLEDIPSAISFAKFMNSSRSFGTP